MTHLNVSDRPRSAQADRDDQGVERIAGCPDTKGTVNR